MAYRKPTRIIAVEAGEGGGGGIESVSAGQNILVDNTDPANPIVVFGLATPGDFGIALIPAAGIVIAMDGGTYLQMTPGDIVLATPTQLLDIGSLNPQQVPHNADVISNLTPTSYSRCIIYDDLTNTLMYSNQTEWVSLP